jgi:hypothetical protein
MLALQETFLIPELPPTIVVIPCILRMILAVPVILPWVQSGLSIVEVKELNDTLPIETNLPMPNFRS